MEKEIKKDEELQQDQLVNQEMSDDELDDIAGGFTSYRRMKTSERVSIDKSGKSYKIC